MLQNPTTPNWPAATTPNKHLIAFPLYKLLSAEFFRRWLDLDKTHIQGTISINHVYIIDAYQKLIQQALKTNPWDRLTFIEQDMLPPLHTLTRMAHYSNEQAIVSATYYKHKPPHPPIAYLDGPDGNYHALSSERIHEWSQQPALHQVDGVGFGCTSIARHVLENWDNNLPLFYNNEQIGHDLWFCRQARKQGHKIYLDTGIQSGHLSEIAVQAEDNNRYL